GVVAVLDAVAVLEADLAGGVDEHGAEGLVAVLERRAGEVDAAAQVLQVGVADRHVTSIGHHRAARERRRGSGTRSRSRATRTVAPRARARACVRSGSRSV